MDDCNWYVSTHWSALEFPCVATAQTTCSDPRSTCKYGAKSPSAAHHGPPAEYLSLAFLAGLLLLNTLEDVTFPSGMVLFSIPSAWSSHEPNKKKVLSQLYDALEGLQYQTSRCIKKIKINLLAAETRDVKHVSLGLVRNQSALLPRS